MKKSDACVVTAIIVAAGSGTRMGNVSKPLIKLGNKTLLEIAIDNFSKSKLVDNIIIVCKNDDISVFSSFLAETSKKITFAVGGDTRAESVSNGVNHAENAEIVCIHDCARPFITPNEIDSVIEACKKNKAATAYSPVKDTVKFIDSENGCIFTPKRDNLFSVSTPQVFYKDVYRVFKAVCDRDNYKSTDDTALAEHAGFKVNYVPVSSINIKLTTPEDIKIAKAIYFLRERGDIE